MKENKALYFIALVPEEPVYSELWQLKEEMHERFATKAALRSPPHITLHMPFKWSAEKEDLLVNSLQSVAASHEPFTVIVDNFGAFEPRVIYVHIEENEQLTLLQKAIAKTAANVWHIYPMARSRPFRPHITIGFRDLKKPKFYQAWEEFQQRKYSQSIQLSSISLLKHNGHTWDIHKNFALNSAAV